MLGNGLRAADECFNPILSQGLPLTASARIATLAGSVGKWRLVDDQGQVHFDSDGKDFESVLDKYSQPQAADL